MYLFFDIGATNTRVAFSKNGKKFDQPGVFATKKDFKEALNFFQEIYNSSCCGKKLKAVIVGVAGAFDEKKTMLVGSNLKDWVDKSLKKNLQKIFKAKIYLENDAALAGLGEAIFGAGKGKKIVAYITVGTGVGGVRIVNGKIDANASGFEPGHQIINCSDVALCPSCQMPGHLEAYVSGQALMRKYGKAPSDIADHEAWDETAKILAFGINNTIVHWSPHIVIIGGSVALKSPHLLFPVTNKYLKELLKIFTKPPLVAKAELGDYGALYGALVYLDNL